jgi:hypothetical protein
MRAGGRGDDPVSMPTEKHTGRGIGVRTELPCLRVPAALMIDDTDLARDEFYVYLKRLSQLVRTYGVKGKMSVTPWLGAGGPIDQRDNPPLKPARLKKIVTAVRALSRSLDITPELITHGRTLDLRTGNLLDTSEWEWSRAQTVPVLTDYISRGMAMLHHVGIETNGVTSPVDFGKGNEQRYARAVLAAEQRMNRRSVAWFFLANAERYRRPVPKVHYLSRDRRAAVLDIQSCLRDLLLFEIVDQGTIRPSQLNALADRYLTADGKQGRLADVITHQGYCTFHTHWWALYNKGTLNGFKVYEKILSRLNRHYRDRIRWMKCSQLAAYRAVQVTARYKVAPQPDGLGIVIHSPHQCPCLTLGVKGVKQVRQVRAGKKLLTRVRSKKRLGTLSWWEEDNRVFICLPVPAGRTRVTVVTAGNCAARQQ